MEVAAIRFLKEGAGCHVVSASIEGRPVLVAFEPDPHEHPRRREQSLGAVRSRRLLHALWALPLQLPWTMGGLTPIDTETLESADATGFVSINGDMLTRTYQPPGRVLAIGVRGARLADAVQRASLYPGIFARYAIGAKPGRSDDEAVATAAALGIGTAVRGRSGLVVHTEAEPPRKGAPGVYRWWMAEVAYEAWLR
jgi:hypothetical protein